MGQIITTVTAGQLTGRHERIIRGWIFSGKLKAQQVHGVWQIDTDDLLACEHVDDEHRAVITIWAAFQAEQQRTDSPLPDEGHERDEAM